MDLKNLSFLLRLNKCLKKNIKKLTKDFWEMSRQRQESFLKELYDLSAQNKSLFQIRLGKDDKLVMKNLLTEAEKQTTNRIGKFRKLRLSKINEILRNADKYALSMHQQIELRRTVCFGMLEFITLNHICQSSMRLQLPDIWINIYKW